MLSAVDVKQQLRGLKKDVMSTKSASKRDAMVKRIKYLDALNRMQIRPESAYTLHNIPVLPPAARPVTQTGGNRMEYADVTQLYRDHMALNNSFKGVANLLSHDQLSNERKGLYDGAKAIFGVGEAITGNSRGENLKGIVRQISGDTGPKQGYFHSKLLSKKQDFSGRATIYAEPDLGFNEAAIPKDMLWTMYEYHIIRDLVKNGYDYVTAKKAVEARDTAATASFNKLIKQIPVLLNRAPTLMRTNVTAHFPVPIEGKTIGLNPIHLPMYAGDFDGDALTVHVPMTPEAVQEAREKLLPEAHIHDLRKGHEESMVAPGHEAILGSMYITEPDTEQETRHFKTEAEALEAYKKGEIKENTPITIGESKD
ncbi:MAG TPA: hypothetical protein VFM18_05320 [Methanosarcina sp.]|nr:hypothetical protein [Methanosarcina sp.]